MKRIFYPLLAGALSFTALSTAIAQNSDPILFDVGTTYLSEEGDKFMTSLKGEVYDGRYYRLIQFSVIPSQAQKEDMISKGVKFLHYVPEKAYIVSVDQKTDLKQFRAYGMRAVVPFVGKLALHRHLYHKEYPGHAMIGNDKIKLNMKLYADVADLEPVKTYLKQKGIEVEGEYAPHKILRIIANISDIDKLSLLPYVEHIEPTDPPAEPENYTAHTNHRSNILMSSHPAGRKYDGSGVIVAMGDDGYVDHIDFQGRIDQSKVQTGGWGQQHGDHVLGIIGGAGNLDPKARGNGWGAFMYVYDPFQNIYDIVNMYNTPGVRITSTSYSNGCNAGYTTFAQTCDQHFGTYPSVQHVFSAGNSGTSNCGYGAGSGWGNVTGGNKIAKNVITVANLGHNDALAGSSSRGPAHDGRIKPDIGAVGTQVFSCMEPNTYRTISGTSMSCPGVSGVLSQLYQGYRALNSNNDPPSGLMKAVILNTADDVGNPGPDYRHGWGRINGRRAIEVIENAQWFTGSMTNGGNANHSLTVPANCAKMKVMVLWTDPAAAVNTSKALVNDIDMSLTTPSSGTLLPWRLDPTPNATALNSNAVRARDSLNNMEQVTIDNPTAGNYTVNVMGYQVPSGPQTYYVVYEYLLNDIHLTYPNGGEGVAPGETERIRWDYFGPAGNFTMQYSTNGGSSWNTVTTSIASSRRYYDWTVPNNVTCQAMVRISRGSYTDQSDDEFTIIGVPSGLQVDTACPNSFDMSWNAVSGASGYQVHWLGAQYMDSIGTSTGTNIKITGVNGTIDRWLSVKALGPTGCEGRRAVAIYKSAGLLNCVVTNDIEVTQVLAPPDGMSISACQPGTPISVSIDIQNNAAGTISNIPVGYRVNGGTIVNDTYTGSINPGGNATHTFSVPYIVSGAGSHYFETWTNYPGDGNTWNDSAQATVTARNTPVVQLPYSENFETFPLCSIDPNCEADNCTVVNGWYNKQNLVEDDIDWRTDDNGTFSQDTGPSADYNPGSVNGNYLYIEPSGNPYCSNRRAELISPCVDLTLANNAILTFAYHMYGAQMGTLHIDVKDSTGWTNDVIPSVSGDQGNQWNVGTVNLSPFLGQIINVRFRGVTGSTFRSDLAIDDVKIDFPTAVEEYSGVSVMFYPNPGKGLFNYSLGLNDVAKIDIKIYDLQGRLVYVEELGSKSGIVNGIIDMTNMANGMYTVHVVANNKAHVTKLVKN